MKIHGVGIRKAEQLVQEGITSIEELKNRQDLLNDVQKKGLQYYDDMQMSLKRGEIVKIDPTQKTICDALTVKNVGKITFNIKITFSMIVIYSNFLLYQ